MQSINKRAVVICALALVAWGMALAAPPSQPGITYERVKLYTGTVGSDQWQWGWAPESNQPSTDAWASWGQLPSGAMDNQCGAVPGKQFHIGGYGGSQLAGCDENDLVSRTWTARAPMPTGVCNGDAVALGDTIYLATGYSYSTGGLMNRTYRYCISSNTWDYITGPNTYNWEPNINTVGGKLYQMGGCATPGASSPSVQTWAYTPGAATPWERKADMSTGRVFAHSVIHEGKIYMAGGTITDVNGITDTEIYDPDTDVWTVDLDMFPELPAPTWSGGCAHPGNTMFIYSGASAGYVKQDIMEFDFGTRTWRTIPAVSGHFTYRLCAVANSLGQGVAFGGSSGGFTPVPNVSYELFAVDHDVGVGAVIVPSADLDSGFEITPTAKISNFGLNAEGPFTATFKIDDIYTDQITITSLESFIDTIVEFAPVTMYQRGLHVASCSTEYSIDMLPFNDKKMNTFTVHVRDVGCIGITNPSGTIDSGAIQIPMGTVYNLGTAPAGFWTMMKIWDPERPELPGYYAQESTYIEVGSNKTLTFSPYTPTIRGNVTVKCSTMYEYELHHSNDARTQTVIVRVSDAEATDIVWPSGGSVGRGLNVPKGRVTNKGTATQSIPATLEIYNSDPTLVYSNTQTMSVAAGESKVYDFPTWFANPPGDYTGKLTTSVPDDMISDNNEATNAFTVGDFTRDVGVVSVNRPTGIEDTLPIIPKVTVKNFGGATETFTVYMTMNLYGAPKYSGDALVENLAGGASVMVEFPEWDGHHDLGDYNVLVYVGMVGDPNQANDTLRSGFKVQIIVPVYAWSQKFDIPMGPKSKKVKDGGSLTYIELVEGAFLYGFKGNNTPEFYRYGIADNVWTTKETIPPLGRAGSLKRVKKGAALAAAGGKIYGHKGNNTLETWEYDPYATDAYPWIEKTSVPYGLNSIKEGSGAVTVVLEDVPYVYLLKGSNTDEFYRYNTLTDVWETKAYAPLGLSGKKYKNGSALAYNGGNIIYAIKGNYNEVYAYDIAANTWATKASLPLSGMSGKPKKNKDGCRMAFLNGTMYCSKGNNTLEFWGYTEATDAWVQAPEIPLGGGKRVKGGAALVYAAMPNPALFFLKGNNVTEFYTFAQSPAFGFEPTPRGNELGGRNVIVSGKLAVAPNPFSGAATISYSLPKAGNVSLRLYDATGSLVTTLTEGYSNAGSFSSRIDASKLAHGIYLLKLNAESYTSTQKLILE